MNWQHELLYVVAGAIVYFALSDVVPKVAGLMLLALVLGTLFVIFTPGYFRA